MPSGILQNDAAKVITNTYVRSEERALYPDAVALRETLQNPATNLCADLDLNRATVAHDRLGFPLSFTGRFAVVFRLVLPGDVPVALRLFTSPEKEFVGERAERLRRVTELLRARQSRLGDLLPPPVYLERAVRVGAEWYPAQILPWAEGEPLLAFVERNRANPSVLRAASATIAEAVNRLERDGIAHGDLQHDNIVVAASGRRITFVDYDALFAPELCDLAPPFERGHRHFQHPGRTVAHYGVGVDGFGSLVLQTGLLLLANDPRLWERFGGALGEGLLLTEQDFMMPDRSALLAIAREQARGDAMLAAVLGELETDLKHAEPMLVHSERRVLSTGIPRRHRRLPARVTPTCAEEQIRPVSYLEPLRTHRFASADRANALLLRAYLLLTPPVVLFAWLAAWDAGGAKWTFLAYLFAISTLLVFGMLYLGWGTKHQWDALITEQGKLRMARDLVRHQRQVLSQRRSRIVARPFDSHDAYRYETQLLRQIPISRAIGDYGVSPSTVRLLRERGMQTADQLARRHGFFPGDISAANAALLRDWLAEETENVRRQFVRETMPEHCIDDEIELLGARLTQQENRLAALEQEKQRFPDASLRAFLRRILPAPGSRAGNALVCGE